MPLAFGSHRSKLVEVLRDGACSQPGEAHRRGVAAAGHLDRRQRPVPRRLHQQAAGAAALRSGRPTASWTRRSRRSTPGGAQTCHQPADVSRLDWIDLRRPERSLFLAAPLAKAAGGTGKCGQAVYKDHNDPDYQAVSKLVRDAVRRAWEFPRRDLEVLVCARARSGPLARTECDKNSGRRPSGSPSPGHRPGEA